MYELTVSVIMVLANHHQFPLSLLNFFLSYQQDASQPRTDRASPNALESPNIVDNNFFSSLLCNGGGFIEIFP